MSIPQYFTKLTDNLYSKKSSFFEGNITHTVFHIIDIITLQFALSSFICGCPASTYPCLVARKTSCTEPSLLTSLLLILLKELRGVILCASRHLSMQFPIK